MCSSKFLHLALLIIPIPVIMFASIISCISSAFSFFLYFHFLLYPVPNNKHFKFASLGRSNVGANLHLMSLRLRSTAVVAKTLGSI